MILINKMNEIVGSLAEVARRWALRQRDTYRCSGPLRPVSLITEYLIKMKMSVGKSVVYGSVLQEKYFQIRNRGRRDGCGRVRIESG